jgi:hypothetical protein
MASRRRKRLTTVRHRKRLTTLAAPPLTLNIRAGARSEYRIYPSIGIGRIGASEDSYMIGPEAPGIPPSGPFRDRDRRIKPQASRFRVYRVEIDANENETVTEEIVVGAQVEIEWTVSVANRKAAGFRIADTLARSSNPKQRNDRFDRDKLVIAANGSVSGSNIRGPTLSGSIEFAKPGAAGVKVENIKLATLRTDEKGRLLVIGGPGTSGSPLNASIEVFSDNDGWYDSVSDGPVSAILRIAGQRQPVVPAWVVITVPRYAPGIYGIVTWYDWAVNVARMGVDGRFNFPKSTSFTRDIYPILRRADNLSAVHGVAHGNGEIRRLSDDARIGAFGDASERAKIFAKLMPIATPATRAQLLPPDGMPQLRSGANPEPNGPTWTYLALTTYQMAHFQNWVRGNFDADWTGSAPSPIGFEEIPIARQPWALCEAALEACIGGSFYPGIEGTYDIARIESYHSEPNLRREFRINPTHQPGFLTEKMALPWQADFADCSDYWWPSQRPVNVVTKAGDKVRWDRDVVGIRQNGHLNMVHLWSDLGFVVFDEATGKFIEDERTLGIAIA